MLTIALIAGACWLSRPEQGGKEPADAIPLPFVSGVLIALSVQVLAWSMLYQFPQERRRLLAIGFPIATTLISIGLGILVNAFMPMKYDNVFGVAIAVTQLGLPALFGGILLFRRCSDAWSKAERRKSQEIP